jgi:hypothetical protein
MTDATPETATAQALVVVRQPATTRFVHLSPVRTPDGPGILLCVTHAPDVQSRCGRFRLSWPAWN